MLLFSGTMSRVEIASLTEEACRV